MSSPTNLGFHAGGGDWGAANLKLKHRISAESPFRGGYTDSKWETALLK